jgi:CDP-diacylglycerol---glycerol-3-phosphate 3-phosphatidyltransferase
MANLLTLSRLLLLGVVVWLFYAESNLAQLLNFLLIIAIFSMDALDGYVARKRNESSLFGALFDIAGDRIVELTLWIVTADIDLVPVWVPLVFIARGVAVDTIRAGQSAAKGVAPFKLMQTKLGKALVAGRFVRALYAAVKASAFSGLALLRPLPEIWPAGWSLIGMPITLLTYLCVYASVVLCLARGLPVIAEFVHAQKAAILNRQ